MPGWPQGPRCLQHFVPLARTERGGLDQALVQVEGELWVVVGEFVENAEPGVEALRVVQDESFQQGRSVTLTRIQQVRDRQPRRPQRGK